MSISFIVSEDWFTYATLSSRKYLGSAGILNHSGRFCGRRVSKLAILDSVFPTAYPCLLQGMFVLSLKFSSFHKQLE